MERMRKMMAIRTRRRRVPSTLPRIAPSVAGDMPWDACEATVGAAAVEDAELDDKVPEELEGNVDELDVADAVGTVVRAEEIAELTGVDVGIAEVGVEVVEGGGVRPP